MASSTSTTWSPGVSELKLFITGASGLLGLNAALELRDRHQVEGCWRSHPVPLDGITTRRLDLLDFEGARRALRASRPDVVLHTAALANVDACEEDPAAAAALNVEIAGHVARIAAEVGARLIHISTDHLFDGTVPMRAEDEPLSPLNEYGRTKAAAEAAVASRCPGALILRTNFFGWGSPIRPSFSDWIVGELTAGRELPMFVDYYFTPLLVNDFVHLTIELLATGATGVYHVAGRDRVSKHEFALRLASVFGYPTSGIRPVPMGAVPLKATRPRDLSLASAKCSRALGRAMPALQESLERLRDLQQAGWPGRVAAAIDSQP